MDEVIKATEENWKEVMDFYLGFMEALKAFQEAAPDVPIDLFGPELQLVYSRRLHRQQPVHVLEHLQWQHVQKGNLSDLYPREPEPEEPIEPVGEPEEDQGKPSEDSPLEPEGGAMKGDESGYPPRNLQYAQKIG